MNALLTTTGLALLLQGAALPDTIIAIQAPVDRGWLETSAAVMQILVSVVLIGMLAAILLGLSRLAAALQEMTTLLRSSHDEISAALHNVRGVAEEIGEVTRSVRADVEAVSETIRTANDGARAALRRAGRRLRRLDALVGVAQEEAEDFVMSSASALRGLRVGAKALRRGFLFFGGNGARRKRRRLRDRAARRRYERMEEYDGEEYEAGELMERPRIRRRVPDEA